MALGSNRPLTEMNAGGLTTLPPSPADCLETHGAGTDIASPFTC